MKLAFSIIVKDDSELESFKESFYSVIPHVDFAQITSNGEKTDGIKAFIESSRGKFPNTTIDYSHLPWEEDFAKQRNHSFDRIPEGFDYIYWQDADDVLVGGELLRSVAQEAKRNGKDVVFFSYWYACEFEGKPSPQTFRAVEIEHYRERLIRPGTSKWVGRLHETPVPIEGQKNNYTKFPYDRKERPVAVMHTAIAEEAVEKMMRNKRILELQLEEERKANTADPRTLLYLMKIYSEIGGEETLYECIEMGKEYLEKSGWDEERANCCDIIAICYSKLGDDYKAIEYLHKAIGEYPHDPLHYIRLANAYFAVERYRESKHWLTIGSQMDLDNKSAGIKNLKEIKILYSQLLLRLSYDVDKDIDKAVEAARLLLKEQPFKENEENLLYMLDLKDLKEASEAAKKLLDYLEDIGEKKLIIPVLSDLPIAITEQPWAISKRQQNTPPRIWKDDEICYFANFNGKHFEKWDARSLNKGIGGSETAVIELSKQWANMGYKVTVYGDPEFIGEYDGVTYLPWYYFNKSDKFNIFIQWRNPILSRFIKAKKFYVDLHDLVSQADFSKEVVQAIDGVFFKSDYHRSLLPELPDSKAFVIGNGITV